MKRVLLSTLVLFGATLGMVQAFPARPLFAPSDPPKAPTPPPVLTVNLAGTVWLGKYTAATPRLYVFETDGTVSYRTPTSKGIPIKNRGTWRMEGNTLVFEHWITKGVTTMEFRGVVKDVNTIVGESTSKAGGKFTQTLQRTTLDK